MQDGAYICLEKTDRKVKGFNRSFTDRGCGGGGGGGGDFTCKQRRNLPKCKLKKCRNWGVM